MMVPALSAFTSYLHAAGWVVEDDDGRTVLWRQAGAPADTDMQIVLPTLETVRDYPDRAYEALRALAYAEQRLPQEIMADIRFGGADNVAVRLTPDAPSGEAPLFLAEAAVSALRTFVVASAAALDVNSLVLPARRPQRAETYAGQARLSMQPGSFVLALALPLLDAYPDQRASAQEGQSLLVDIPPQPFGRRVSDRMLAVARRAQLLADEVGRGDRPLAAFGRAEPHAPNATELAALGELGGPDHDLYQLRFAWSPLASAAREPLRLKITPSQQRILGEASEFLRTRQPRSGVTVQGLVVRLYREGKFGRGEVVIQGIDDDSGVARRFRVELDETDYREAVRAHGNGLQVIATGDLDIRGTRLSLRPLRSFAVMPGLDD
ncbi:MAG: hypothetical protein JWN52_4494 [Actinomycetia bacterium]|nr:hypothetical protein [Actinomycetes bacterium]